MFKDIKTVAIYVSDKEKAKRFYTEILGFVESVDLGPNLCFLRSENGKINIYLQGGMKKTNYNSDNCRLSFFLRAEDSIYHIFEYLQNAKVTILQKQPEIVGDNIGTFQFLDLDNNIIEVEGSLTS